MSDEKKLKRTGNFYNLLSRFERRQGEIVLDKPYVSKGLTAKTVLQKAVLEKQPDKKIINLFNYQPKLILFRAIKRFLLWVGIIHHKKIDAEAIKKAECIKMAKNGFSFSEENVRSFRHYLMNTRDNNGDSLLEYVLKEDILSEKALLDIARSIDKNLLQRDSVKHFNHHDIKFKLGRSIDFALLFSKNPKLIKIIANRSNGMELTEDQLPAFKKSCLKEMIFADQPVVFTQDIVEHYGEYFIGVKDGSGYDVLDFALQNKMSEHIIVKLAKELGVQSKDIEAFKLSRIKSWVVEKNRPDFIDAIGTTVLTGDALLAFKKSYFKKMIFADQPVVFTKNIVEQYGEYFIGVKDVSGYDALDFALQNKMPEHIIIKLAKELGVQSKDIEAFKLSRIKSWVVEKNSPDFIDAIGTTILTEDALLAFKKDCLKEMVFADQPVVFTKNIVEQYGEYFIGVKDVSGHDALDFALQHNMSTHIVEKLLLMTSKNDLIGRKNYNYRVGSTSININSVLDYAIIMGYPAALIVNIAKKLDIQLDDPNQYMRLRAEALFLMPKKMKRYKPIKNPMNSVKKRFSFGKKALEPIWIETEESFNDFQLKALLNIQHLKSLMDADIKGRWLHQHIKQYCSHKTALTDILQKELIKEWVQDIITGKEFYELRPKIAKEASVVLAGPPMFYVREMDYTIMPKTVIDVAILYQSSNALIRALYEKAYGDVYSLDNIDEFKKERMVEMLKGDHKFLNFSKAMVEKYPELLAMEKNEKGETGLEFALSRDIGISTLESMLSTMKDLALVKAYKVMFPYIKVKTKGLFSKKDELGSMFNKELGNRENKSLIYQQIRKNNTTNQDSKDASDLGLKP